MRYILLLLILMSTLALADFEVIVEPTVDEIDPGQSGVYDIIVRNNGPDSDEFQFKFSEDPSWSVITSPIFHQTSLKVNPGEEKTTVLTITPDSSVDSGRKYSYGFNIESKLNDIQRSVTVDLFLRNTDALRGYVPIVSIDVDVNSELDPREKAILTVNLRNYNPLNISDLRVSIDSEVNDENDEVYDVDLAGLERKSLEFSLEYDHLEPPKTEEITVSAWIPSQNKTFETQSKTFQIMPYNEIIRDTDRQESFLKAEVYLTYFNNGNVAKEETYRIRTSLFKQMFTKTEPEADMVLDSGYRYLEWNMNLYPQEQKDIRIVMNYRPLFIISVVLVVLVILYFIFRSPVVVKKDAVRLTKGDEVKIKVLLHLKNRTGKMVENVHLLDKVPALAHLDDNFPVGTMQPTKVIKHEKKGTILKWTVPTLEAYEERIITYHIGSKLRIIGTIKLPAAMIKYKNQMGRFSKVYSGKTSAE